MQRFLRKLVHDFGWIHLGIGLVGNCLFILGSLAFLPGLGFVVLPVAAQAVEWQTVGVWLFILGSTLMFIGQLGELLVSLYDRKHRRDDRKHRRG